MHRCDLSGCDGTRLGHDLARDFPAETQRLNKALDRLRGSREDRVMPENLQVDDRENLASPHVRNDDDS